VVLNVDPLIIFEIKGPMTAQCHEIALDSEFEMAFGWVAFY
jgi:hypothetical protein